VRNYNWIKQFNSKIVCFKDLPREHQMAMTYYMSIDGDAWGWMGVLAKKGVNLNWDNYNYAQKRAKYLLENSLHYYVRTYGEKKFGMVDIPIQALADRIISKNPIVNENGWKNLKELNEWYGLNFTIPKHSNKNRWPVILATTCEKVDHEIIEDGWHRFNTYIKQGAKKIPCLFYI